MLNKQKKQLYYQGTAEPRRVSIALKISQDVCVAVMVAPWIN